MNYNIYKKLSSIGKSIPKEWMKKAHYTQESKKEGVNEWLKWSKGRKRHQRNEKKERELEFYNKQGAFSQKETITNDKYVKKIDNFVQGKVKHLIDSGQLPKPQLDSWSQRIMAKAQKK